MSDLSPVSWLRQEILFLRQWLPSGKDQDPLLHTLHQIERRLGTPDERNDDLEEARRIAHLLRNRAIGLSLD